MNEFTQNKRTRYFLTASGTYVVVLSH